jgi:Protein of unknown function (DUF3306)
MSEPETVLARWLRRKRQSASQDREDADETPAGVAEAGAQERDAVNTEAPAPPFDVSSLPPIESIVAGSDIRAFLQKGVPAALTRVALRQAWSSDPAIRDFIEIAENQWDFADPKNIPGFGPLGPTDDVQQLVARALGELRAEAESVGGGIREGRVTPPPAGDAGLDTPQASDVHSDVHEEIVEQIVADRSDVRASDPEPLRALQHEGSAIANTDTPSRRRRKHGSALPS